MKDLLVILAAAASSSSSVHPPNHRRRRRHHHSTPFPQSKPSPTPAKKTARPPKPPPLRWDPVSAALSDHSPIKHYADLASKLAAAGRFRHFLLVAESAVASGIEPLGFVALLDPELVSAGVARLLSQEGMAWRVVDVLWGSDGLGFGALKLFDGVRRETVTKEVARECRRILENGDVEEAVELMEILSGFHFPIRELVEPSEIVGLCVRKRDPDLAIRFACIHPHTHVVFCTIIHEFGKKGDMMSALTAFEASKQKLSGPNMYAYRTVIDVCGLCGDHLKSRSVYEELLAEKITPNVYVFNSLMNVNAHDLDYVMHVYDDMRILGVTGDITSYNILLKSCCLAARVDLAQDIYCEVQSLESTGVLKLDVFTYSTIIKIFADAKLWRMALKIKGDLLSAGFTPNVVIWSSLISACANAGLVEQAIQLFTDMLLAGCVPNSQCCNALLYACVEGQQYDRAFRLFQSWKENGFDVNVCSNAGVEHARGNSSHTMSKLHNLNYSRTAPFTPTTATYNILMKACGTNYLRAKALIDEMHAVGLSPNYISWTTLINVCGGSGSVDGAMQILSSMREAAGQPDVIAYTSAIKVCVERKFLDTAFYLLEEMRSHQIRPNLVTYKTLLRARSRYGSLQEVQQCLEIYQDMRKAGYKPNDYYLKQLIEEWCEGVIQNDNQIESKFTSLQKGDIGGPYSFLLEKVASHLERRNTQSVVIDLQGLTKVEARIVVLAVLRMIKENHAQGCPLKDDLFIIIGVQKADMMNVTDKYEVEDAIIKLLRNEFRLEVILEGPKKVYLGASANEQGIVGSKRLPTELQFPRRPAVLRRLKVTRISLLFWLQKWDSAN